MTTKKDEPKEWAAELDIDTADRTYRFRNVRFFPDINGDNVDLMLPYVLVGAEDELGAYSAAQRVMGRLGFSMKTA